MIRTIIDFLKQPHLYIVIVLIGTSLKFYNLDARLFWEDEISTVLHTSGIPLSEYPDLIPQNEICSSKIYNDLLHLNKQNYSITEQIKGLFFDTHLTPLHYVPLMIWHRLVGDDPVDYRLFSVFIFIISLPVLFLMAKELFKSELTAWIAISLYAISPTFHLFARESRYYILWAFFIILSHYLFLKALRHNQLKWWILYTAAGILSLYTSVVSGILIFGHMLYLLFFKRELWLNFIISAGVMLLMYGPWIYSMFINREEIFAAMSWQVNTDYGLNPVMPLIFQLMGFTQIFVYLVDWGQFTGGSANVQGPMMGVALLLMLIILILLIIGVIYLFRKSSREVKYFLFLLILPMMLFYYTLDLIRNSWLSVIWRYQMISLTAVLLLMANYLGGKIRSGKAIYIFLFIGVVLICLFSVNVLSGNPCWMTRYDCPEDRNDARLLTQSGHILVITDFAKQFNNFLVVLNECNSDSIDVLYAKPDIDNLDDLMYEKNYSDILVFHASEELVQNLKNRFGPKLDSLGLDGNSLIWQLHYRR